MLRIRIRYRGDETLVEHEKGAIEIGRAGRRDLPRAIIVDPCVSKNQAVIERLSDGFLHLRNISDKVPMVCADGHRLNPGAERAMTLPASFQAGETVFEVSTGESGASITRQSLQTISRPLRRSETGKLGAIGALGALGDSPDGTSLALWFESILAVLRSSGQSGAFMQDAARALVDMVGLDAGYVLLRQGEGWQTAGSFVRPGRTAVEVSHSILRFVVEEKRTFYKGLEQLGETSSLIGVKAVVASPVLDDETGDVVGAVYGIRGTAPDGPALSEIKTLEAQIVQVLAAAVGTGLARVRTEEEAAKRHLQFEQFFSPELASELDRDPSLLEGKRHTVTILFSDIRGFSRMSERLAPERVCALVRDVMERLSARIRDHEGVVVDYVGDGLLAMWNAPRQQVEHARLAARAALAMLGELPALSDKWSAEVGGPIKLGIGLNTGEALVGNVGSQQKFKYGPLGHTVNVASRIESATKEWGVPVLMSGTTRAQIGIDFAVRRLSKVRPVGVDEAIELYELAGSIASESWLERQKVYETALEHYEHKRFAECCRELYKILSGAQGDYDVPSLTLVGAAIQKLRGRGEEFDPVFDQGSK